VCDVTVGKAIRCMVEADDADAARRQVEELCHRFLTNPVIEEATITIEPAPATVG